MAGDPSWLAYDDDLLVALLPPFGPRAETMASRAVLKVAAGHELVVEGSELSCLDAAGRTLEVLGGAFGLPGGSRLSGPLCRELRDRRPRPAGVVSLRWSFGERKVAVAPEGERAPGDDLRLLALPLQVPVRDDVHLLTQFTNAGRVTERSVDAVRGAVLWVDGDPFASATGGHWDGPSIVPPGGTFAYPFSLADFPGAPREGEHELGLEMFDRRSTSLRVRWIGRPWSGSPEP